MTGIVDINVVGSRIRIRRPRVTDAERYFEWFANSQVTEFLPLAGKETIPLDSIREFLSSVERSDRPELGLAIETADRLVGCGGFRNFQDGSAEISIVLGEPSAWGQGLGREAMSLMLDFGFTRLTLQSAWLVVRADNSRAVALFKSLGFFETERRPGVVVVDDIPRDKLRMELHRSLYLGVNR